MRLIFTSALLLMLAAFSPAFSQTNNANLVGSYIVTGTEPDGKAYDGAGTLEIAFDKNGALELKWDGGRYLGIGQVVGDNKLAVASWAEGRVIVGIMDIKPDGSLEGKYWRRTDPGTRGTEVWKKK